MQQKCLFVAMICDSVNNIENMWRRMATLCATLRGELEAMLGVPADVIPFLREQENRWFRAIEHGLVTSVLPTHELVDRWEKNNMFDLASRDGLSPSLTARGGVGIFKFS